MQLQPDAEALVHDDRAPSGGGRTSAGSGSTANTVFCNAPVAAVLPADAWQCPQLELLVSNGVSMGIPRPPGAAAAVPLAAADALRPPPALAKLEDLRGLLNLLAELDSSLHIQQLLLEDLAVCALPSDVIKDMHEAEAQHVQATFVEV